MFSHISKAVFQICLALSLVVAATVSAQAGGPLTFNVTRCATSASRGGNQVVDFNFYVNNVSKFDYITKLNWIEVEVTSQRTNGSITKHRFVRNLNIVFNPSLSPQRRIKLHHRFAVHTGSSPYARVAVDIKRWNYSRAK